MDRDNTGGYACRTCAKDEKVDRIFGMWTTISLRFRLFVTPASPFGTEHIQEDIGHLLEKWKRERAKK